MAVDTQDLDVSPQIAQKLKDPGFAAQRTQYLDRAARGQVMMTGQLGLQYGITAQDVETRRAELFAMEEDGDEPEGLAGEVLSVREIDTQLSELETRITGMDKRIKSLVFRFTNNSAIEGKNVSEATRDEAWTAELPNLQASEQEILGDISRTMRQLQEARRHIGIVDVALDVSADEYAKSATILPMIEREAAGLSGEQLAAKLRSVSLRNDRTLTLAWVHATRSWAEKHASDRKKGEAISVAADLERGFQSKQSKDLQAKFDRIEEGARKARNRIERARQARGQVPQFLQGIVKDRPVTGRIHGYE